MRLEFISWFLWNEGFYLSKWYITYLFKSQLTFYAFSYFNEFISYLRLHNTCLLMSDFSSTLRYFADWCFLICRYALMIYLLFSPPYASFRCFSKRWACDEMSASRENALDLAWFRVSYSALIDDLLAFMWAGFITYTLIIIHAVITPRFIKSRTYWYISFHTYDLNIRIQQRRLLWEHRIWLIAYIWFSSIT